MTGNRLPKLLTYLTAWALLFSTLTYGQTQSTPSKNATRDNGQAVFARYAEYLIPVGGSEADEGFRTESQHIARLITGKKAKNVVLIDNYGTARESVLASVAARLDKSTSKKRASKR